MIEFVLYPRETLQQLFRNALALKNIRLNVVRSYLILSYLEA